MLADVVWTGGGGSPVDDNSGTLSKSPEKSIPLRLCYVCQSSDSSVSGGTGSGGNVIIEVHSPDAKSSLLLRCPDESSASQWLTSICNVVSLLTAQAIAEVNSSVFGGLSNTTGVNNNDVGQSGGEIKHMGWVAEQVLVC